MRSNRPARCGTNPRVAVFDYKYTFLDSGHEQSQRESNRQERTKKNRAEFQTPQPQQAQAGNKPVNPEIQQYHACIAPCYARLDRASEQAQHKIPTENLCGDKDAGGQGKMARPGCQGNYQGRTKKDQIN